MTERPRPRRRPHRDPARRHLVLGIGAILVIAVISAISYDALSGLPFEDRAHLTIEVPDAARLHATDEVRIGGVRVGQVGDVRAEPGSGGRAPYARIRLVLDRSVGRIPADSTASVRLASVLGASYVDLSLGHATASVREGGTLDARRAPERVELVDLFRIFDGSARRNFTRAIAGLGDGLAGRGVALNATIHSLRVLSPHLERVMRRLAAPATRLPAFIRGYAAALDALAPAADRLAGVMAGGAVTFAAFDRARGPLAAAIELAPVAEGEATVALRAVQPGLDGLARTARALRPGAAVLPLALARINAALASGAPALRGLPRLSGPLRTVLIALSSLARDPATSGALRKLGELLPSFGLTVSALGEAQRQCNVLALAGQNFGGFVGGIGTGAGPSFWNLGISTHGAQSDGYQAKEHAPDLAVNYTPHENRHECESGNEPDPNGKQAIGNPAGLQTNHARRTTPPPGTLALARKAGLLAGSGATR